MDLNELFFRHQIALMRLSAARSSLEREYYEAEASQFARCIATIQRRLGARGARVVEACCQ